MFDVFCIYEYINEYVFLPQMSIGHYQFGFCPPCSSVYSTQSRHGKQNGHYLAPMRLCDSCGMVGSWKPMQGCRNHLQKFSLTMAEINHYFSAIVMEATESNERKLYKLISQSHKAQFFLI